MHAHTYTLGATFIKSRTNNWLGKIPSDKFMLFIFRGDININTSTISYNLHQMAHFSNATKQRTDQSKHVFGCFFFFALSFLRRVWRLAFTMHFNHSSVCLFLVTACNLVCRTKWFIEKCMRWNLQFKIFTITLMGPPRCLSHPKQAT